MPTALIIGAGSRVGEATAHAFAKAGYTVAVASRSNNLASKYPYFPFDASKPDTVRGLFNDVRKAAGPPSVVIYNAYGAHTDPNPFALPLDTFTADLAINATSSWLAAGEAVKAFEDLGTNLGASGGTFIFTGNLFNDSVAPGFVTFGMGKSAAAHLIKNLALVAYKDKPYKFYYPDQRLADGTPMYTGLSGPGHAELYLELATDPQQRPWQQTFVVGKGYVEFPKLESLEPRL